VLLTPLVNYFNSKEFAERNSTALDNAKKGTTPRENDRGLVAQKLESSKEAFKPVDFLHMMQKVSSPFEKYP
jgi:hypothetical protein